MEQEKIAPQGGMFDGFRKEGEPMAPPVPEKEAPPPGPSPEKGEGKETPPITEDKIEDESKLPFHKHPRWKKIVGEKRALEERLSGYDERIGRFESYLSKVESMKIPGEFVELYGDNPEAWEKFRQLNERLNPGPAPDQEEGVRRQEAWVEGQLSSLEDEGEEFDRNALLKVLHDYVPTDERGNIDFKKGLALLRRFGEIDSLKASGQAKARKEIAASTTSSKAGDRPSQALTPERLRKMDWREAARLGG